jgi:hypothetical protein
MNEDESIERLKASADRLYEFYDSVLILASVNNEKGETSFHYSKRGNYFAITGMASHYLDQEQLKNSTIEDE